MTTKFTNVSSAMVIETLKSLLKASKDTQSVILESIKTKTSLNNMKYDEIGQRFVKAIQEAEEIIQSISSIRK